jgi:Domain of unknown function (DUF397)
MGKADAPASNWRKSSFSEAGNCVEVADRGGLVLVRDSKHAAGAGVLSFSLPAWREFIRVVDKV